MIERHKMKEYETVKLRNDGHQTGQCPSRLLEEIGPRKSGGNFSDLQKSARENASSWRDLEEKAGIREKSARITSRIDEGKLAEPGEAVAG